MKKTSLFKLIEIILTIIGMVGMVVVLYKGNVCMTLCTLIFWIIAGSIFYLYRRNSRYGILSGLIGISLFLGILLFLYQENGPITTIFFGTFVPIAGGLTIFLGGMLGMILAEIVKFIINLLWTDKRANA